MEMLLPLSFLVNFIFSASPIIELAAWDVVVQHTQNKKIITNSTYGEKTELDGCPPVETPFVRVILLGKKDTNWRRRK